MTKFVQLTSGFAIAGQLDDDDLARAARLGFRTIVNNRPDGEEDGQPDARAARKAAERHGLFYVHIPTTKHDVFTEAVVGDMALALAQRDGPILAHCKSGQRSALVWAAAAARSRPVREVLDVLEDAGFDFGFLRDELDKQADRACWKEPAPAAVAGPAKSQAAA
jgi:uncharacterized protein (TIGR01244 family)